MLLIPVSFVCVLFCFFGEVHSDSWARCLLCAAVPLRDDPRVVLVSQDAHRGRTKRKETARLGRQTQPACSQDQQDMHVSEHENVARTGERSFDYHLRPGGELLEVFATDYSISPQGPAGPLDLDLGSGSSLVLSVVPFPQICVDDRAIAIPGELTCFPGSL